MFQTLRLNEIFVIKIRITITKRLGILNHKLVFNSIIIIQFAATSRKFSLKRPKLLNSETWIWKYETDLLFDDLTQYASTATRQFTRHFRICKLYLVLEHPYCKRSERFENRSTLKNFQHSDSNNSLLDVEGRLDCGDS